MGRRALRMAESRGHPVSIALTNYVIATIHQCRREPELVRKHAEASLKLNLDQGAPMFPTVLLAWLEAGDGDPESSLAKIQAELSQLQKMPDWWRVHFQILIGDVLARAGRHEEAVDAIRRGYELSGNGRLGSYYAELHRFEGMFLNCLGHDRADEAERAVRRAVEIARKQNARMLELRALVTLSGLLEPLGRVDEVRPMLAETYGWFTEGFDTPDLQDARAILEGAP
jgi:adenylate cyclase